MPPVQEFPQDKPSINGATFYYSTAIASFWIVMIVLYYIILIGILVALFRTVGVVSFFENIQATIAANIFLALPIGIVCIIAVVSVPYTFYLLIENKKKIQTKEPQLQFLREGLIFKNWNLIPWNEISMIQKQRVGGLRLQSDTYFNLLMKNGASFKLELDHIQDESRVEEVLATYAKLHAIPFDTGVV